MKCMKWMNWHEPSDMNDLKWRNWNWDEWIDMNELNRINRHEGIDMKEFKRMTWHEWIETNELTWMNSKEWIGMNELKRMWNEWNETNELKCMICRPHLEKVVRTRQFLTNFMWSTTWWRCRRQMKWSSPYSRARTLSTSLSTSSSKSAKRPSAFFLTIFMWNRATVSCACCRPLSRIKARTRGNRDPVAATTDGHFNVGSWLVLGPPKQFLVPE